MGSQHDWPAAAANGKRFPRKVLPTQNSNLILCLNQRQNHFDPLTTLPINRIQRNAGLTFSPAHSPIKTIRASTKMTLARRVDTDSTSNTARRRNNARVILLDALSVRNNFGALLHRNYSYAASCSPLPLTLSPSSARSVQKENDDKIVSAPIVKNA